MIQLYALVKETFLEALSKKILVGFFILSTLGLIIIALVFNTKGMQTTISSLQPTPEDPSGVALLEFLRSLQTGVSTFFALISLLLSVFITANFIPTMLEKGTIDLLLSKPISRTKLLFGKSLGGMFVVMISMGYFILGEWLIVSTSTGMWDSGFLLSFIPLFIAFMSLYSVIILVGVTIQSPALAIIICYLHLSIISIVLHSRESFLFKFLTGDIWRNIITGMYHILPQTQDIGNIAVNLIQHKTITNFEPIFGALAFSAVVFGISAYIFSRKEF